MAADVIISESDLKKYRNRTFFRSPAKRLHNEQDAIDFVNHRGLIFFWPIKGIDYPNLWEAVAGKRPVPNNHDDPAHVTWNWKDNLLGKKAWYYGKIIRQKSTFISLELLPSFYALSPNYGSPEDDYLISYEEGVLSNEEKLVYEALLANGSLDSLSLRKAANLSSRENASRFSRAITLLQRDFRILPIGIAEAGAWHYAYIYDTVHHHFPDLSEEAHTISETSARLNILKSFFLSIGSALRSEIKSFFMWPDSSLEKSLIHLVEEGFLLNNILIENKQGEGFTIRELFDN